GNSALLASISPNASRRSGEWIGRYVKRRLDAIGSDALDVALLTHFHPDHMGDVEADSPLSRFGTYQLSGITDVAEVVPIRRMIDRSYPRYDYPAVRHDATMENYRAFVASAPRGMRTEAFAVGSTTQLAPQREPSAFPNFNARNLAASGVVWSGHGDATVAHFPPSATLAADAQPDENMCSLALRVRYGAFGYYAGGDLTDSTDDGLAPWRDIETPVAQVCGPVDVAAVDHHGYYDAGGPGFVRSLRPRVFVLQAWHATHPALSTLERLYSTHLFAGERDVFATALVPAAAAVNDRFVGRLKSTAGHVVVRVAAGGASYDVAIIDDTDESDRVLATFGSYTSRSAPAG
ncbi:MAG: hypothetical protein JO164_11465, partial [Candidatus Eremiobacteraeota bacterium]|nr:hypothetical protein [Candidatus Eremiobacteraeota bacterium]